MKILFVSENYYPQIGGVETQTRLVAHQLARRHAVTVAAISFQDNTRPDVSGQVSKEGRLRITQSTRSRIKQLPGIAHIVKCRNAVNALRKEVRDCLSMQTYGSYRDGEVPVHALTPPLADRLKCTIVAGFRYLLLGRGRRTGDISFRELFFEAAYAQSLGALIRECDVVHCVAAGPLGWVAQGVAHAERVPFVVTPYVHPGHHGDDPRNAAFYRRADIVFTLLDSGRDVLINLGVAPHRLRLSGVVPLLPTTSDGAQFRRRYGLGDSPVVLYIGRMVEYKGYQALHDAAAYVWRELPHVHFLFAGPLETYAREQIAHWSDSRSRYLGVLTEQEKGDALAACDVFCMPSLSEILPAVYLEAWSHGKPVVGGMAHGLRELIEGNRGGMVVEQDPEAIARLLVGLLRDEPRRRAMGESGRALVNRRFSLNALATAFEDAYGHVISRRAVASEFETTVS